MSATATAQEPRGERQKSGRSKIILAVAGGLAVLLVASVGTWWAHSSSREGAELGSPEAVAAGERLAARLSSNDEIVAKRQAVAGTDLFHYSFGEEDLAEGEDGTPFIANQLLVSTAEGAGLEDVEEIAEDLGARVVGVNTFLDDYQLLLEEPLGDVEALQDLAGQVANRDGVRESDGNWLSSTTLNSVENAGEAQSALKDRDVWGPQALGAQPIWDYIEENGPLESVRVGVVDHFYDDRWHENLGERGDAFIPEEGSSDRYNSAHGLHVSGIIAAEPDETTGMAGIAPNAEIAVAAPRFIRKECNEKEDESVYFCGLLKSKETDRYTLLGALTFAVKPSTQSGRTRILNLSFGADIVPGGMKNNAGSVAFGKYLAERLDKLTTLRGERTRPLKMPDFLIVKASGNESCSARLREYKGCTEGNASADWELRGAAEEFPEVSSRLITVGSLATLEDEDGLAVTASSNSGADLVAPGNDILSTTDMTAEDDSDDPKGIEAENTYSAMTGTSQAAPHISGLAATIFGVNPDLTAAQVKQIVVGTANAAPKALWNQDGKDAYVAPIANGAAAFQVALMTTEMETVEREAFLNEIAPPDEGKEEVMKGSYKVAGTNLSTQLLGTWCTVGEASADSCFNLKDYLEAEDNEDMTLMEGSTRNDPTLKPVDGTARHTTAASLGICEAGKCDEVDPSVRLIYYPPGAVSEAESDDPGHDVAYPRLIEGYADENKDRVHLSEPYRLTLGTSGTYPELPFELTTKPIELPASCEAMNPALYAAAQGHPYAPPPEAPTDGLENNHLGMLGPSATEAVSQSIQSNNCSYAESTGSGATQWVMELPAETREEFLGSLQADGAFMESSLNGATQFSYTEPQGQGGTWTYIFVGDTMLIALVGPMPHPESYAQPAVDALLDINPSLASEGR